MQTESINNKTGSHRWLRRLVRRILGTVAAYPHRQWSKTLIAAETPKIRVWIEQHRATEQGCLRYISNTLGRTPECYHALVEYLRYFVSRQCMSAMILCDENHQFSCLGLRNLLKRVLSFFCFCFVSTKPKSAANPPNIPSSATPQAGLEPRKRNGGEQ